MKTKTFYLSLILQLAIIFALEAGINLHDY